MEGIFNSYHFFKKSNPFKKSIFSFLNIISFLSLGKRKLNHWKKQKKSFLYPPCPRPASVTILVLLTAFSSALDCFLLEKTSVMLQSENYAPCHPQPQALHLFYSYPFLLLSLDNSRDGKSLLSISSLTPFIRSKPYLLLH